MFDVFYFKMPCFKYNSAFLANPDFSEGIGSWNFKLLNLTFSQSCLLYSVSKHKKINQIFNWPKECLFTSVSFTEISWKFCLLADGQGVGIVFRHWIHFLNYPNKKTFKKDSSTMNVEIPTVSSLASPGEMFSAVNVDARTEVRQGRAGPEKPLNINLALTNTLRVNHYRIWPSHPQTALS